MAVGDVGDVGDDVVVVSPSVAICWRNPVQMLDVCQPFNPPPHPPSYCTWSQVDPYEEATSSSTANGGGGSGDGDGGGDDALAAGHRASRRVEVVPPPRDRSHAEFINPQLSLGNQVNGGNRIVFKKRSGR